MTEKNISEIAKKLGRLGGKTSWAKQTEGKTKEEIALMMSKRKKGKKKIKSYEDK